MLQFEVSFADATLRGDRWTPAHSHGTVLLLHGGGTSSAAGFTELRQHLFSSGVETLAFDFVGHGRTGGLQSGSTLRERVEQVSAVLEAQALKRTNLTLAGFSMGAYVAAKCAASAGVARLCLAIPAAYAPEAYEAPFGPEFSRILRTPRSWAESDAFQIIREFPGDLLVISAENDQVVPAEIPRAYASRRNEGASTIHHIIKGAGHKLSEHFEREPAARTAAYAEIASLCAR